MNDNTKKGYMKLLVILGFFLAVVAISSVFVDSFTTDVAKAWYGGLVFLVGGAGSYFVVKKLNID